MRLVRSARGWALIGLALALLLVLAWSPIARHLRAAQVLQRLSTPVTVRGPDELQIENVTIIGPDGPIRARLYFARRQAAGAGIVVAHGVHYRGIDEARLVTFSRALARTGVTVLTPELADLADYRITQGGVDVLRNSVHYLAARRDRVSSDRVGLLGFSFAGGLALVAAEDARTASRLAFVTSVGGHHDLRRVMRFLVHDEIETPAGIVRRPAHDYGLVVLVYGNLEHFVPAADLPCMRAAFRAWLHEDRTLAREVADCRTTHEADEMWELLETERLQILAPELDRLLQAQTAALDALSSAGRLHRLSVPVYLLHGTGDSVIPSFETDAAHAELTRGAGVEHRALVSPLLEHVEVSKKAGIRDEWALLSFMAQLL